MTQFEQKNNFYNLAALLPSYVSLVSVKLVYFICMAINSTSRVEFNLEGWTVCVNLHL